MSLFPGERPLGGVFSENEKEPDGLGSLEGPVKEVFASRSVSLLLGVQTAICVGARIAEMIGVNAPLRAFEFFVWQSKKSLLFVLEMLGWYPTGVVFLTLLVVAVYYPVAVVVAVPSRFVYRSVQLRHERA